MADLIDRATLMTDIGEAVVFSGRPGRNAEICGANKIIARIETAPAVDAVPVVRCKDCQYKEAWQRINEMGVAVYVCDASGMILVDDLAFCSFGERRTDGDL